MTDFGIGETLVWLGYVIGRAACTSTVVVTRPLRSAHVMRLPWRA